MTRPKRKKAHEKEPNLERWLVSYADFITLLFAVFVMLYAMSIVDQKKMEEVQASIQSSFSHDQTSSPALKVIGSKDFGLIPEVLDQPVPPEPQDEVAAAAEAQEFSQIKEEVQANLQEYGAKNEVQLTINERGLVISLKEAGFFPSGTDKVQPESLPLLDKIASSISRYANTIRIEGHTDNVPVNSPAFPSNWELSTARANSLVHYLIEKHGFKGAKLSVTGYAEYRPIADNATEEGRKLNRRVDIVMLSRKGAQGEALKFGGE
ncbi:MAG TPA: flagellar motor protein MotB [Desulfurivibrionaceae bacterium]|jgi:chemotaxis protein MotB